ncbi:MAG: hypothetical protein AAGN82_12080 [Myxococcota bacterium]
MTVSLPVLRIALFGFLLVACGAPSAPTVAKSRRARVRPPLATLDERIASMSRSDLDRLLARPMPKRAPVPVPRKPVASWSFGAAEADRAAWRSTVTSLRVLPGERELRAEAPPFDDAHDCLAHQFAHLYLRTTGRPPPRLERRMRSFCGVVAADVVAAYAVLEAPSAVATEPGREKYLRPTLRTQVAAARKRLVTLQVEGGPRRRGLAVVRREGRTVIALVSSVQLLDVQSWRRRRGRLELLGSGPPETRSVSAFATRGRTGWERCSVAGTRPTLRVTCEVTPSDDEVRVDLFVSHEVAPRQQLSFIAARRGRASMRWEPVPVSDGEASAATLLLAAVNRRRRERSLRPLVNAPAQSSLLARLAPRAYVRRLARGAAKDVVMFNAMLAGWDVSTPLSGARGSTMLERAPTAAAWVTEVLDGPLRRGYLYDPDAKYFAVGTDDGSAADPGVVGLVGVYTPFRRREPDGLAEEVMQTLDEARAAAGRQPAPRVRLDPMARALSQVAGGTDPIWAVRKAAKSMYTRTGTVHVPITLSAPWDTVPTWMGRASGAVDIRVVHRHLPQHNRSLQLVLMLLEVNAGH